VRSSGSRRNRQARWIRPFRRTNRAIDSTLRLVALSQFLLDECEIFAEVRPRWATRQMRRVSGRLVQAVARLKRGAESIKAVNDCVAHTPEAAGDAPERLIGAMEGWLYAAAEIADLSDRIEDTSATLAAYITSGMAPPLDLDELLEKERPIRKLIVFRLPAPRVLSIENDRIFRIHVRRQRSVRLTVAEAPRRIFRGRAPPLVSTCSL
jgi:hypothetical protein